MGITENVELVRRGYEAFNSGDVASLGDLFDEDVVWHAGGNGVLSGPKHGRDAVLSYLGELGARTQGHIQATVKDIIGGENCIVAIQQTQGTNGDKTIDASTIITFVVRDGKISEAHEYAEDTGKLDDFWA